jgi:hypothetical protein
MFEILTCVRIPASSFDSTATRTHRIFRPGHVSTPTRPSSHPRGFRLFTCQRASLLKSYVINPYRFADVKLFSPSPSGFASSALPVRLREAESYRSFRRCQSAVAKIFVQPSRVADRPLKQPVPRPARLLSPTVKPRSAIDFGDKITEEPRRFASSSRSFQRCCKSNLRPGSLTCRSSNTASRSGIEWQEQTLTNSARAS